MKILLITPGITEKFNDNYHAYKAMARSGNRLFAISNKENINKGGRLKPEPEEEVDGAITIFRVFDSIRQQQSFFGRLRPRRLVLSRIAEFNPDIIICEEISNLPFAAEIKRIYKIPVVLRTEFAFNPKYPYRVAGRVLKRFRSPVTGDRVAIAVGWLLWRWSVAKSDSIISCYFDDAHHEPMVSKTPFYHVPWPTYLPKLAQVSARDRYRAVFIGAFDEHKNLEELLTTVPALIKETPLKEFYIVGTGQSLDVVTKLSSLLPGSVHHIQSMSREECLKLIQSSFFSYSPATRGGWGFIGDSWAMRTPIVVTHNHYQFRDGVDSILTSSEDVVSRVKCLYADDAEYRRLQDGGIKRFHENHAAEAVGLRFLDICIKAVQKKAN